MALQKLFKLEVKPQLSHHFIRRSEHCQSARRTAKNIETDRVFFFCISSLRVKVQKFTGFHPVYSRAHSLHVHSTTVRKMKSLKWFHLQRIYLAVVKLDRPGCLIL